MNHPTAYTFRKGHKFGPYEIISDEKFRDKWRHVKYLCQCKCGYKTYIRTYNIVHEKPQRCRECNRREVLTKHGYRLSKATSTYSAWARMKQISKIYDIDIDPKWEIFENFLQDMQEKPLKMYLKLKDKYRGYSKENCEWDYLYKKTNK